MLDKIRNRLERLGLPITYQANTFLATSTEFRGGDTLTGLWAYEGNCWDEIEKRSYSWPQFVATVKGISIADANKWLEGDEIEDGDVEEREEKIKMPEKLKESDYKNLTKSYNFFLKRGISVETLDTFGAGLAESGPMYGRVCFPIRCNGVLKGITGRDVLNRDGIKWKIKGRKGEFIFPLFEPEVFQKTKQICLIESVGDSLSLWNSGIKQNLVQFGLSLSSKQLSFIISQNPEKVFICLNNDKDSLENRGQDAALKIKKKLEMFFSSNKIIIAPPLLNDFGEQTKEENLKWAKKYDIIAE